MIRDWSAMVASTAVAAPPPPWPVPSVLARPAVAGDTPKGAASFLGAVRPPWRARATVSRGTPPDRYGRPAATEVDCLVVRLVGPDGARAWAAWWDGKFKFAAVFQSGKLEKVGVTALRERVGA